MVYTVGNADFTLFMQNSITGLCGAVLLFRCSVNKNLQDIYINTIILGIPNRFISSATIMLNIAYNEV